MLVNPSAIASNLGPVIDKKKPDSFECSGKSWSGKSGNGSEGLNGMPAELSATSSFPNGMDDGGPTGLQVGSPPKAYQPLPKLPETQREDFVTNGTDTMVRVH